MKTTQCDRILRHLKDYGTITSLEATEEYGILRLASRINDLKNRGYNIKSTMGTSLKRYQEKVHYSIYYLEEK